MNNRKNTSGNKVASWSLNLLKANKQNAKYDTALSSALLEAAAKKVNGSK